MSVKLLLNPASEAQLCVHPETGVSFRIRPISPEKHEEIRRASTDDEGKFNPVKWSANYAVAAIAGWSDEVGDANGPLPCTDENKRIFGRNHAVNIMPWITERASSLDQYRIKEEAAAKKD